MPGSVPIHNVIARSDSEVELAPHRPSRRSVLIYNNSAVDLFVSYVAGVSSSEFLVKIPANWYGRMPWGEVYTGIIYGVWATAGAGDAQVTELVH